MILDFVSNTTYIDDFIKFQLVEAEEQIEDFCNI